MLTLRKRREVKTLLRKGRPQATVALVSGVSLSSVKRISKEPDVEHLDDAAERLRRRIGRPSIVRRFRDLIVELLHREPDIRSIEIFRRIRLLGYSGGRTTIYTFVASVAEGLRTAARSTPGVRQHAPPEGRRPAGRTARG